MVYHNTSQYITIKKNDDYKDFHCVNTWYLIIGEADGYTEEKNGNKYLTFAFTDKNKKSLTKYIELWDEIKYLIKTTNDHKVGEYWKDFMKIKFSSDDNLPLNKTLKPHRLTVVAWSVFEEDGEYYPQVFWDKCLYEL